MRLPHFLIIGAPKCGTTWLHRSLMHNRAVRMPQQEVAFFEDPDFHDGNCAQLAGLFTRAPAGALLGIKRPSYFAKPECPARIAAHVPQAMLIVLLRNPVDRAISDYYHNMRYGHLPLEDPDVAFRRMLAGGYDPLFVGRILESGLYARALARYRDHFAPEQIFLVVQHRASDHLLDRYADVCRFLAIHNDVPLHLLDRRHNRGIYDADALNRIRTLNPYLYDYDRSIGRLHARTDAPAWAARAGARLLTIYRRFRHGGRSAAAAATGVSAATRRALADYYRDDIEQLERMTQTALSAWKVPA